MDDGNVQKAWERPWSTEEIRAQCSSWNLAGDAGLLKHLQEFSQNLMQKTHTAEVALDSLLEDMRNTSVDVQNATNALLMLSNNQFVENRVYDDCEDEKEEVGGGSKEDGSKVASAAVVGASGESVLIAKAAEAILLGMSVIDTKFDCVEVPASDSEGEEDGRNATLNNTKSFALVLEPRNPYASQPLPHLIGSKEFMEDDRVGLGGGEEEEEDDEEEEEEDDDARLLLGQDHLVTQGLNDSGSSLAGDMGDEGIFDDEEDEVDDRRAVKASRKQAWDSSSSNGSDDLVVENNIMRQKPKRRTVASRGDVSPFGNEEGDEDLFGGKGSSSGDEFMEPIQRTGPPTLPKSQKDDDGETIAKQEKDIHKKQEVPETKKVNDTKSAEIPSNTLVTDPTDNPFGPPKDEWKEDEDGDSIFAASDGIFSGGRGLFDDLEDPFMSANRRDINQFQPPSLPDKPPAFKGADDKTAVLKESKDIFGEDDDDDQDVFGSILTKAKPPSQPQAKIKGEAPKKQLPKPEKPTEKVLKGVGGTEGEDSWIFDEPDQDDPLWNVGVKKEISHHGAGGKVETVDAESNGKFKDDEFNEDTKAATQPKLPVGARSFYAGGVDPLALGKKLTKELEGKRKMKQDRESEDVSERTDVSSKAVHSKGDNLDQKSVAIEKKSVKASKYSPDSGSLFDDLGDGDDLFASANTKATKPKEISHGNKGDLMDEKLFAPNKSASISAKVEETQKKSTKTTSSGVIDKSNNLFGDFASDDDNDDIFAGSKALGPGSLSSSKLSSNKGQKMFSESPDPLFDDILGKDEELFPGSLDKNIFSGEEVEDDLFSDFNKVKEGKSIKNGKEESSNAFKTETKVPVCNDDKSSGLGNTITKTNNFDKSHDSDDVFGSLGVKSLEKDESKSSRKIEASGSTKDKPLPAKNTKIEFDDIFGDADDTLMGGGGTKSVGGIDTVPRIADDPTKSVEVKKLDNKSNKTSKLENLFDEFVNDDEDDFLSSSKGDPKKSGLSSDTLFPSKPTNSKDLFSEFDSDGDDQKFFTPRGGRMKVDPLDSDDPLRDSLFSRTKPAEVKDTLSPSLLKEEPPDFSLERPDRKKTELTVGHVKSAVRGGKGSERATLGDDDSAQVLIGGSVTRKSPPKTLNLEKVIASPRPEGRAVNEDFVGTNDAEDERIVQAWMKGHPPPLRDSKVETVNGEDDITPGYTPPLSSDDYGPSKHEELNSSYFADIPSASLLHSHGKERARIQSHRRPPSRKVRKGSATSVDPPPPLVAAVDDGVKPAEVTPSAAKEGEEDGGSQGTIEEWSTPEAGLASPPPAPLLPRSNPLSPSTDEEQDFFDVLPIGHYPPPVDPPSSQHLSPFSDALGAVEEAWDDGALFEDARPMEPGSLWDVDVASAAGSAPPPPPPLGVPSESGTVDSKAKHSVGEGGEGTDLFSKADPGSMAESERGSGGASKKSSKSKGKKESAGKLDDDLWGNGFRSKTKDDIFAEDFESARVSDLDDIFQGEGDLFGASKAVASSYQETKKVSRANDVTKGMGRSLSKLDSKSKAPVSLFDDDDDTEDLFSSPHSSQTAPVKASNSMKKSSTVRPTASEQPTKSSLVKVAVASDDSIFEDPLMVLKRKE